MEQDLNLISNRRSLYERRFRRVIDYLYENLERDLDLNSLAEVACMSPYHWHRVYQSFFGESIVATVKRLRMQRAASLLVNTRMTVDEIAKQCAYSNLQSFTRIFSAVYGMPPARYRQEGSHQHFSQSLTIANHGNQIMFKVEIQEVAGDSLVGIPHQGSYLNIGRAFDQLVGVAASRQLFSATTRMIGIYLDDPALVEEEKLRSIACISVTAEVQKQSADAPLQATQIEAGTCAVLHYQGPYSDMHAAYQWLFGVWLPASGYEAADQPVFEVYLNNPRETAPNDLLTDICLPLKRKD